MKSGNLYDVIDFRIAFCREMIEDNGEDCFFIGLNDSYSILSVFDGCGGAGARQYGNFNEKTGAYIASRTAGGATEAWFSGLSEATLNSESYKGIIERAFSRLSDYADKSGPVMRGSMQKAFPTTLATAVIGMNGKNMDVDFFWAGDSRGYILNESGLHQATLDDLDGEDAMSNLLNDGVMTNLVYLNGNYSIHRKRVKLKKPSLVFCATDGCFGYLSTPMEFEYLILETLFKSETPVEWKELLEGEIEKVASDDFTFAMQANGFGSFDELKKTFFGRKQFLESEYISKLENANYEEMLFLWNQYKVSYENTERE